MQYPFPLPDPEWPPLAPFWAGAAAGHLRLPRCSACRAWRWYPQEHCEACGGTASPEWQTLGGRGRLFSWVVVHRAFLPEFAGQVPYVTALVALVEDETLRVPTRIVDCRPDHLHADMQVEAVFRPLPFGGASHRIAAPFFRPCDASLRDDSECGG